MAYDIDRAHKIPRTRKLFFRWGGPDLVRLYRKGVRRLGGSAVVGRPGESCSHFEGPIFGFDWKTIAEDFRAKRYAFINPFLSPGFYECFAPNWPSRAYLEPPSKPAKWYDWGYRWKNDWDEPKCMLRNPALDRLISAMEQPDFVQPLSVAVGVDLEFHEFHLTESGPGAEVPIHLDSLLKHDRGHDTVGIAFFVAGTGGPRSGGLAISRTNRWQDVIFEPTDLDNTALLYSKQLHHGFRPIAKGKFRRSINTRFRPHSKAASDAADP